MTGRLDCRVRVSTPRVPAALAVITLTGDVVPALAALTGIAKWPLGSVRHFELVGIDDLLLMRPAETTALLTPHGGPRIVAHLLERLVETGVSLVGDSSGLSDSIPDAAELLRIYPEAADVHEARMLDLLARAASPLAIPMLLKLPDRWRRGDGVTLSPRERRLIEPPRIAIVGPPNAGKSTLLNRLVGRDMAIASDFAGTTRDHIVARVDMAGLVVDLLDTPGVRESDDQIERHARRIAQTAIGGADLVINLAAPRQPWAERSTLPEVPILRIASHADVERRDDADLCVSALTGEGIDRLRELVRDGW